MWTLSYAVGPVCCGSFTYNALFVILSSIPVVILLSIILEINHLSDVDSTLTLIRDVPLSCCSYGPFVVSLQKILRVLLLGLSGS